MSATGTLTRLQSTESRAWSERAVDEHTHQIEFHGELEAEDGERLSQRILELAREGTRWLVISCPESMRRAPDLPPCRPRPW